MSNLHRELAPINLDTETSRPAAQRERPRRPTR
jgi:hypothetical protein